MGSSAFGHYVCYVRDATGTWREYNDTKVGGGGVYVEVYVSCSRFIVVGSGHGCAQA